jgi:hypothetical protein
VAYTGGADIMVKLQKELVICQGCKEQKKMSEVLSAEIVRESIVEKIMATHPDWSSRDTMWDVAYSLPKPTKHSFCGVEQVSSINS